MAFFDDEAEADEFRFPEPARRPWKGDTDDTLGAPVPFAGFLVRNDALAVLLAGLVAFPAGFTVTVVAVSRLSPPKVPINILGRGGPVGRDPAEERFRFGIGFSDGSKVSDRWHRRPPDGDPGQRVLQHRSGEGGDRRFSQAFWCAPLPPAGPMRFVCQWPAHGIEESSLEIDAQLVLDAAAAAVAIWPEDMSLSGDEGTAGWGAGGGPSYRSSQMLRG